MTLFFELFENIPRQGPGSKKTTERAFNFLKEYLPENPEILDIGCGCGMQTKELVSLTKGNIVAFDNHSPFLEKIDRWAKENNLSDRLRTVNGDMKKLDFPENYFDLIWSEGAVYIMGFDEGLKSWGRYLKQGGVMAVSHISWIKENPPTEIEKYWQKEYPEIADDKAYRKTIEKNGYELLGSFVLPKSDWMENLYGPLGKKVEEFRITYKDREGAAELFDAIDGEIEMYEKYGDWYGYIFYIMRKI